MAIKCSAEITATNQIDATDLIMWYYATTLTTKPLSPSTTSASITPTGWSLIEPTITSASDLSKYIYECLQIVWGDGTCSWGDVQLSASFEAAKQAYNLAHSTASIFTTFEQTHNKTLVDTVNESSSAITTLTESHQYGGINLLSNTKSIDSLSVPYTNSNISLYSNQAPIDGESFYYCSGPKYFQIDFPTLINNQKYTLSFDISRSSNSQPVFVKIDGTETNIGTAATTWTRLSHTFIASASTTNAQIRVAFDSTSSTATYIAAIRHIKLEQGSLATPWEYSSNDISTLSNTVNTVSQTVDSNNSTISNLTQTLGTNANGTTKTDDIVHQVSDISQDLNGITTRVGKTEIALKGNYAISSTAKGTANKQATISPTLANYELVQGAAITVKFATENTAANPTLNINSTGAKPIKTYSGAALSENEYKWDAGSTMTFVYDGTNWCIQDSTELTRIKNNETLINQTANNILIKATESDTTAAQGGQHLIQSLINVAPNGIKISADKVDIEGAAIFSENGYLSQDNINAINNESQTIYIQAVSGTSSISGTTTWVTNTGESVTQDAANLTPVWTLKRPIYRTKYPVLFVATQYKTIDGTITCTTPLKDDTITVIDAGHITTGTIDASNITVTNLNADNITTGTINGQRIGVGSLSLDKLAEDVYTETEVDNIVDNLQTQIDGAIETWTGTAVPTLNNAPASGWTTNAIKDTHVGDVYFVVNSQSQQNGYNYRFTKSGGTYSWQLIKDNDVTNALQRLETAEGKITSIESFDSTVSSFMTNTDSELTSVKSRATSLETRMTDAEGDISEKVDTSTFNTLSQTVDGNSASITSMGTVLTNNGLTSSTNITNTMNTVSQTASGNSSKITQLTTTLGTNADGTTKAGDVVHRTSAIEQDVSSFKTTVSETYATKTEISDAKTYVANAKANYGYQYKKDIVIYGESSKYYPVYFTNVNAIPQTVTHDIMIRREYSERAPSDWNTSTHKGGLNIHFGWNFGGWGGATYKCEVYEFTQMYSTMVGDVLVGADAGMFSIVYLRGGGTTGALYHVYSDVPFTRHAYMTNAGVVGENDVPYIGLEQGIKYAQNPAGDNPTYKWNVRAPLTEPNTAHLNELYTVNRTASIESRVTTAESTIEQHGASIALKANSADVYTKSGVDGLISTEVTNRNAAITAKANEITSTVSQNYTTKQEFADLEVGGRNLLGSTSNPSSKSVVQNDTSSRTFGDIGKYNDPVSAYSFEDYDGYSNAVKWTSTGTGNRGVGWYTKVGEIKAGTEYTFTCKVKSSVAVSVHTHTAWRNGSATATYTGWTSAGATTVPANTWTDYSYTFEPNSSAQLDWEFFVAICFTGSSSGVTFRVAHAKLEKGNKATDWTPAPEDIETRVSSAESAITQNANNIALKVSESDVTGNYLIGKINLNSTTASIAAQHINLQGAVTISDLSSDAQSATLNSNISVGGRNLLRDTDILRTGGSYWFFAGGNTIAVTTNNSDPDGGNNATLVTVSGAADHFIAYRAQPITELGWYTFSIWMKASAAHSLKLTLENNGEYRKTFALTTSWQRFDMSFDITTLSTTNYLIIGGYSSWAGATPNIYFYHPKLEKGNVATDWTPAPEDMASSTDSVEFILGTQTAATGSWTGVTRDSSLYTGKTIAYKLPYAGSGSASLQLKDSSGNNVGGNIAVYSMTTRVTTHYPAGSVIQMTYDGTYWRTAGWYNSNNYDRNLHNNYVKAAANVVSGQLVCGTSAGYKPIAASTTFDMSYPILWASGTWISGKQYINAYETYPSVNPATTATVQDIAVNKMVYVKGQISGNTFTCVASNFLTCIVPTSEDGYFYLPVGIVANDATTKMYFNTSNDLYAYLDGKFRQVTPTEIMASQRIYYRSKVSGTVPKPTAWVTFATNQYNDTVSVGNGGWSTKVTPIAASKAENVDKYLYLYTCEQRKRLDGTVECTDVTLDENTTIIDGGNIITHTVTAEQLNATSINASKSLTVGAMTDTAAATILNSNINVGGRNLLPMSDRLGASGTSSHGLSWSFGDDGWIALSGTIDTTSSFAPVFWGHTVSESAPDYTWPAGTYTFTLETTGTPLVYGLVRVQVYVESGVSQYLDGAGTVTFTATNGIQRIGLYVNANADGETVNGALRYKLEKGTMSTDWTPAPEDTNDAIVNVASDISESLENMDGTLNDFANTLETQSADIGESINEVQDQLNALREDFESEVNAREQWLSFNSSEGLVIGENESNFKTVTTATSMEFRNGDTVLARAAGEEFSVPSLRSEELHLGNWMWVPRSNGNLALKWIGE